MGASFQVDLEGFKRMVAEFTKAAPDASLEGLENGFKCVSLAYLNIEPVPEDRGADQIIAVSYFEYAGGRYHDRLFELIREARRA